MAVDLWLRAVNAADARGLLPPNHARLTPAELAAEVARRGENRLARLVECWYYPASYGHIRGSLSDEEAERLVAAMEAQMTQSPIALPQIAAPAVKDSTPRRPPECELCGSPLTLWK
jgi:hypothetical protein